MFPHPSHAQRAFGGLEVAMIPCTCGGVYVWHYFVPLYLGTSVPVVGALAALSAVPLTFPNYYLHPKGWALGFYTPAVQACYMIAYPCVLLPSLGVIMPFTGVSL